MAVGWQEVLLQSLEARDQREQAYVPFIHQCKEDERQRRQVVLI